MTNEISTTTAPHTAPTHNEAETEWLTAQAVLVYVQAREAMSMKNNEAHLLGTYDAITQRILRLLDVPSQP